MSILGALLDRGRRGDVLDSDWSGARRAARQGSGSVTTAPVDVDTALAHSAVWSCATLIADMIATFPWHAYQKNGEVRSRVNSELIDSPSDVVSPIVWRTQVLLSVLLQGNAFGKVTRWSGTTPTRVEIVAPGAVSYTKRPDGTEDWRLHGDPIQPWPVGPLWHMPGYVLPGQRLGLSVLGYAARAINLGHSATEFGGGWFDDGVHPTGMLGFDGALTETEAEVAKKRWMEKLYGTREPVVLGKGWEYTPVQIAAEDSQFLETIGANVADVARFFRVQPELIGATSGGSSITYANVEQRSLSVMQFTLGPWTYRFEESLGLLLPQPQYTKASTDAFLRTDAATSSTIIDRELKNGMLNLDEGRALKDRPPVPDIGELHVWPPLPSVQLSTQENPDVPA